MATLKNGFYSNGYFNNTSSPTATPSQSGKNVIALASDNNKVYIYNKNTGRVVSLYTGVPNTDSVNEQYDTQNVQGSSFYAQGVLYGTGVDPFTNTYYLSGNPSAGVFGGKTYVAGGSLAQGAYNGRYYVNGLPGSNVRFDYGGDPNNLVYKNGLLFTGVIFPTGGGNEPNLTGWNNFPAGYSAADANINILHVNGAPSTGTFGGKVYDSTGPLYNENLGTRRSAVVKSRLYYGNDLASGEYQGVYYKKGTPYSGYIVSTGVNDQVNAVNADVRKMTPNAYSDLHPNVWQENGLGTVGQDLSDSINYNGHFMINGQLANGPIISRTYDVGNGTTIIKNYSNGILLTNDGINNGLLYKAGVTFSGTLSANAQKTATFAGQTISLPSTGVNTFINGVVAHGLISNKYYEKGVLLNTNNVTTRTLYFSAGVLATGTINGVTYSNGIEMWS